MEPPLRPHHHLTQPPPSFKRGPEMEITEIERSYLAKIEELSGRLTRKELDLSSALTSLEWANRKIKRLEDVIAEDRETEDA
jgi:hypothetical protein